MDFLDPKRKKAHRRRLFIGYVLMAIAISMGTLILLFTAYGFDYDRSTGQVIQNGSVIVDSKPSNADVYVNGEKQNGNTGTRLALPGGKQYSILLAKENYRDWSRTLSVEGGKIEKLDYAMLFPKDIKTTELQLYASMPGLVSQSKDKKRMLVQQAGQTFVFDLYDMSNPKSSPKILTLPASILPTPTAASSIGVSEWSEDGKHVVLTRTYNNRVDFLLIDTDAVEKSVNISAISGLTINALQLVEGKIDSAWSYEANGGVIKKVNLNDNSVSAALVTNVISFDGVGDDTIVYLTADKAPEGSVSVRMREDDKATYLLRNLPISDSYLLKAEMSDGTPYIVVGASKADTSFVYRDPLPALKGQRTTPLLVRTIFRGTNQRNPQFSENELFLSVQATQGMLVYDIEGDRQFTFKPQNDATLTWIDGHRFTYVLNNEFYSVDFDGSNVNKLVGVQAGGYGYFTPNRELLISFSPSATVSGRTSLLQSDLIVR